MPITRDLREAQLKKLMQSNNGQLVALYCKAVGIPAGQSPPVGMLLSAMIDAILKHEYQATQNQP